METRRWWAALQLLDRQLMDREGMMAGNVDDVELEIDELGVVHVTALVAGPGALWRRLGARRLGDWFRRAHHRVEPSGADGDDPARIPLARVADIGNHVTVSLRHQEMGTFHGERWARDHLIGHIPGSRHAPPAE